MPQSCIIKPAHSHYACQFFLRSEELARMKEKDRLRKEYVEELRKRHEEEASRLETQLAKEQRARREEQAARVEVCMVPK